jgi:hypothetical protein
VELFTATGKLNKFFLQLVNFDVCATVDTAHIEAIFNDPCLKARIIAAVKHIDAPMLTPVWQELEYCIDVCHVTPGAPIEHL